MCPVGGDCPLYSGTCGLCEWWRGDGSMPGQQVERKHERRVHAVGNFAGNLFKEV